MAIQHIVSECGPSRVSLKWGTPGVDLKVGSGSGGTVYVTGGFKILSRCLTTYTVHKMTVDADTIIYRHRSRIATRQNKTDLG